MFACTHGLAKQSVHGRRTRQSSHQVPRMRVASSQTRASQSSTLYPQLHAFPSRLHVCSDSLAHACGAHTTLGAQNKPPPTLVRTVAPLHSHSRSSSRPTAMRFDRGRTNWHFGADSCSGKCATRYSAIASPAIASPANASPAITQLPHAHKHWSATLTPAPRGRRARQTAHPPPAWASARPHSPAGSGRRRRRPP